MRSVVWFNTCCWHLCLYYSSRLIKTALKHEPFRKNVVSRTVWVHTSLGHVAHHAPLLGTCLAQPSHQIPLVDICNPAHLQPLEECLCLLPSFRCACVEEFRQVRRSHSTPLLLKQCMRAVVWFNTCCWHLCLYYSSRLIKTALKHEPFRKHVVSHTVWVHTSLGHVAHHAPLLGTRLAPPLHSTPLVDICNPVHLQLFEECLCLLPRVRLDQFLQVVSPHLARTTRAQLEQRFCEFARNDAHCWHLRANHHLRLFQITL